MQRKIAIVLAIMVLGYSISVSADTDSADDNTLEELTMISVEDEPWTGDTDSTISDNNTPFEKEDTKHEEEKQETSPIELPEETSAQENLGTTDEVLEEGSTEELTQQPEELPEETSAQENLETADKVLEEGSTKESTQQPEKNDSETSTEKETLPLSVENKPEESGRTQLEKLLENNKEALTEQRERKVILSEGDIIYNISFPTNVHAYLDPGDLSGNGQIFSEHYQIENFGNTDVAIKIKSIQIRYKSEEGSYEFSEEEITESLPRIKKMNVDMVWEKEGGADQKTLHVVEDISDEYVIELKAAGNEADSVGYFYFTGTMNPNPNINWEDDDLSITFHYEILSFADMEEEILTYEDDLEDDIPDIKNYNEKSLADVAVTENQEMQSKETEHSKIISAAEIDKADQKELGFQEEKETESAVKRSEETKPKGDIATEAP